MLIRCVIKFLRFFLIENSNIQIAASVVLGLFLSFFPLLSIQWVFIFIVSLLFRFNIATILFSFCLFEGVISFLENIFDSIGMRLLTQSPNLIVLWRWMYHAPVLPFTYFNHTVGLAGFIISLIMSFPLFLTIYYLMKKYRFRIQQKWHSTRLFRVYATNY